jgi:hypothetical protein
MLLAGLNYKAVFSKQLVGWCSFAAHAVSLQDKIFYLGRHLPQGHCVLYCLGRYTTKKNGSLTFAALYSIFKEHSLYSLQKEIHCILWHFEFYC